MTFVFEPWIREMIKPKPKIEWKTCAPMFTERACFSHLVLDNQVYVFGGISGNR